MDILICSNYQEISKRAANIIIQEISSNPSINLGLATGSTPIGLYENLVKAYQQRKVSFEKVKTFNLDEYIGLSKEETTSYHYYMHKHLFDQVNINKKNIFLPNNDLTTLQDNVEEYNTLLKENKIDLQLLGIGSNGHIGFNEPGVSFSNETFIVELDLKTRLDNARFFSSINDVPMKAITMGIQNIMEAKRILLLASGKDKAEAIKQAVYGDINTSLPASILQKHPNCTMILDEDAASLL